MPLPLAKDMFALMWHCGLLTPWDNAVPEVQKSSAAAVIAGIGVSILDYKAAVALRLMKQ